MQLSGERRTKERANRIGVGLTSLSSGVLRLAAGTAAPR